MQKAICAVTLSSALFLANTAAAQAPTNTASDGEAQNKSLERVIERGPHDKVVETSRMVLDGKGNLIPAKGEYNRCGPRGFRQ